MYQITSVPGGYQALPGQPQRDGRRSQPSRQRKRSLPGREDEVQISAAAYELARRAEPPGDEQLDDEAKG